MTRTERDDGPTRDNVVAGAGASTDQHITGAPETGTFLTDEPPTDQTPADGSSNAGINKLRANRPGATGDDPDRERR